MSEHTKEPWVVGYENCGGGNNIHAGGLRIAHTAGSRSHNDDKQAISEATAKANARRIVACVNACRGLATDDLEQSGLVSAVGSELLRIEQQRDELLAALESAKWMLERDYIDPQKYAVIEKCDAAIVKAKGGAA